MKALYSCFIREYPGHQKCEPRTVTKNVSSFLKGLSSGNDFYNMINAGINVACAGNRHGDRPDYPQTLQEGLVNDLLGQMRHHKMHTSHGWSRTLLGSRNFPTSVHSTVYRMELPLKHYALTIRIHQSECNR